VTRLTELERNWFRSTFTAFSIRTTGSAWEDFVANAMFSLHGGAFVQVDASGRGDRGCDGYVKGLMLAAYGASSPNDAYVTRKINTDFAKAKEYWGSVMKRWAFVHNNAQGLPVMAGQAIAALQHAENGGDIAVEQWPPQVLWKECLGVLAREDLSSLLGAPPSAEAAGMEYIAACVRALARTRRTTDLDDVAEVPPGKIEHNGFSAETAALIKDYEPHTGHVRYYFRHSSPGESYQVAEDLKMRYHGHLAGLKDADLVFHALVDDLVQQAFANDGAGDVAQRRSAALMVVTHFFESCIIFEEPPTTRSYSAAAV
jgi:hypothetical protein